MATTATPRTRTRTRTRALPLSDEVTPDNTPTKIVLEEEGNEVEIVEQIGGKTARYMAKIKEDTSQNNATQETNTDDEDDSEGIFEADYQENPKTGLDKAFDDITYFVRVEGLEDHFFAKVARLPDSIGEQWFSTARDRFELGVISFTSRDRFAFISELQKLNGHSGGRLMIDVYDYKHDPIMVQRTPQHQASQISFQIVIQNPPPQPIEENGHGQLGGLGSVLKEMQENNRQMMQFMRESINKPREKSALESAIEQKVLNDILNPPQGNNGTNGFEQVMMQMMLMPQMINKMSDKMFPEIALPAEPTTFDRIMQVFDKPVIQNTLQNAVGMLQAAHENKMIIDQQKAGIPITQTDEDEFEDMPQQQNPQPQVNQQQVVTELIMGELESDRELNASNTMIQHLQAEFPTQVNMLKMTCKGGSFDDVLKMLLEQTANIQPYPFLPYLDGEASRASQDYVFNEHGERLKTRLLEFYNYVRST